MSFLMPKMPSYTPPPAMGEIDKAQSEREARLEAQEKSQNLLHDPGQEELIVDYYILRIELILFSVFLILQLQWLRLEIQWIQQGDMSNGRRTINSI